MSYIYLFSWYYKSFSLLSYWKYKTGISHLSYPEYRTSHLSPHHLTFPSDLEFFFLSVILQCSLSLRGDDKCHIQGWALIHIIFIVPCASSCLLDYHSRQREASLIKNWEQQLPLMNISMKKAVWYYVKYKILKMLSFKGW